MKLHPVYLHFPDWQFKSYFLILSVMVLDQFCLGFVRLILRFFWGGGQICEKYVPSTCYIFLSSPPHPLKKLTKCSSEGGGSKSMRDTSPALVTVFCPPLPPPLKKGPNVLQRGEGVKNLRNTSTALVTFFFPPISTPPQFSKILLKWGGESKKVLYCNILTSPPQIG